MARIFVIGGLNMDLHLFGLSHSAGQAPLVADRYLAQPGGKGANVARAAARLGAAVNLVGRVGDDEFGRDCVAAVAADGVNVSHVATTSDVSTGFVAIELVEGKHRSLLFAPGANKRLGWSDIEPALAGVEPTDIVIAQAEIPTSALDELARFAANRRFALFLDPTPPEAVNRDHLAAADVITPDLVEAAQLVGRRAESRLWPALAARELLECGAQRVIVKTGASGAVLGEAGGVVQVPTLSVEVFDETGAGDVFLAALAVAKTEGADWTQATSFANTASALSVEATGLTLPRRKAVDDRASELSGPSTRIL